ncbi:uncharacterized protein [Dermacentor albipictus]
MFLGIVALVIFLLVGSINSDDGQDDFGNSDGGGVGGGGGNGGGGGGGGNGGGGGGGGGGGSSLPPPVPIVIIVGTPASTTTPPSVVPASGPRQPVLPSGGPVPQSGGPPSPPGGPVPPPVRRAPSPTGPAPPATSKPKPTPTTKTQLPKYRELLCTVGESAVIKSMYPPDRMCTYLYYTHVVILGDRIHAAKVENSWSSFKYEPLKYGNVDMGASFDYRYVTVDKIRGATRAMTELYGYNRIRNFGVLNVVAKAGDILKAVQSMKPVFDEIFKHFNGSHNVIAIGVRDYSSPSMVSFEQAVKLALDSLAVDTVIAISSAISAESRADCRAVPPNILYSSAEDKNPSLVKLWPLLKRNATDKQTTTLGLSFEMGTLIYELTSDQNDLASAINAKCYRGSLTGREALCGTAKDVDKGKQTLAAPYLTYGGFPTSGNKKRVVFTDYQHSATERFLNVSGGTGSDNLRSRVAWMLFNVHLEDTAKTCGGIEPFELENSFCKAFLPSGEGC